MFDPSSGVLAAPLTATSPIQNPLTQQQGPDEATLAAMAQARAKQNALQQALYRAAVLREQPGGGYAQGAGPLGARQGQGPMGWAVTLGDVVAGLMAKKKQGQSSGEVTGAMGALSPAEQNYVEQYLKGDVSALPRTGKSPMSYVAQGSPLSLSNE